MQNNWNKRAVGEIVVSFPLSSEVFRSAGIDFCCGGKRLLGDVIEEQRLVDEKIYRALDDLAECAEAPAEPFPDMSAERLVEYILTRHHSYLWKALPETHGLLTDVLKAHGGRHPELYDVYKLYGQLAHEMEPHLIREETELFPAVANGERENCLALVHILEEEHEAAGSLLKQLRHATNDYSVPCDGCDTFRELYRKLVELEGDTLQHYHLENNILFPKITGEAPRA